MSKFTKEDKGFGVCNCTEIGPDSTTDSFAGMGLKERNPSLLLHSCCGPCSTSVIERLAPDYSITVFYYNPCITNEEEYLIRKENQKLFLDEFNKSSTGFDNVAFIEGDYEPEAYLEAVKGYEKEPEGGARCKICFRQRLRATALRAKELEMEFFATTLTVSPHKNYSIISAMGQEIAEEVGIKFLDMDFKKKAGFQRSIQLSKDYGLYRQDYCGCDFSKNKL